MKSAIYSILCLSCLVASFTLPAIGQGTAGSTPQKPVTPNIGKELKFKLEWTTVSDPANPTKSTTSESIVLCTIDGQTSLSTNLATGTEIYRRVTLHPDIQVDGTYLLDVQVAELLKDQDRDITRVATAVRLRANETKVVQSRTAKGTNYAYDYLFTITPITE